MEFIAASMTYDMHNTDKLGVFREDAAHAGITMLPPDINRSEVLFSVEDGAIRYALAAIRNVGAAAMEGVVRERTNGAYIDIFDFAGRVPPEALNRRALEFLIKAGAFDSLHPNRNQLFANIDSIMAHGAAIQRDKESSQVSLFGDAGGVAIQKPTLAEVPAGTVLEKLEDEFSAIGFYLSAHPLAGYASALDGLRVISSSLFADKLDGQFRTVKVAGIVTGRKFKVSDKGRFAFIQLSDMAGVYEVSVFDEGILNQQRDSLENGRILLVTADAKMDDNGMRLIAKNIALLDEALLKHQQTAQQPGLFRIVVNQPEALISIRNLLGDPNGRGAQVRLRAQLGEQMADIELPGKYSVSPSLLDKIRVVNGVVSAEEIAA